MAMKVCLVFNLSAPKEFWWVDFSCVIYIVRIYAASRKKSKPLIRTWYRSYSQEEMQKGKRKRRNSKKGIVRMLVCKRSISKWSEWKGIQTGIESRQQTANIFKIIQSNPGFDQAETQFLYITQYRKGCTVTQRRSFTCKYNTFVCVCVCVCVNWTDSHYICTLSR